MRREGYSVAAEMALQRLEAGVRDLDEARIAEARGWLLRHAAGLEKHGMADVARPLRERVRALAGGAR